LNTPREDSGIELRRYYEGPRRKMAKRWQKYDVYAFISYYKVEEAKRIIILRILFFFFGSKIEE